MSGIRLCGIGLSSVFGGFLDSCAAERSGLSRMTDHSDMATMFKGEREPTPISIARSADVYEGYQGVGRRVKLLVSAFEDFQQQRRDKSFPDDLVIFFATPDPRDRLLDDSIDDEEISRERRLSDYANTIINPFYKKCAPQFAQKPLQMVFGDRVAFARVLRKAKNEVALGRHCLLLFVDTLLDDNFIQQLVVDDLLKTSDQPTGFIPGEGASCILLGPIGSTQTSATVDMNLSVEFSNFSAQETHHDEVFDDKESDESEYEQSNIEFDAESWDASVLYSQLKAALPYPPKSQHVISLASDMNGAQYRAMEYGLLLVKIKNDFPELTVVDLEPAAISFGETGLMAGIYAFCLAVAAFGRKYSTTQEQCILLSELEGRRAALRLEYLGG